MTVARFFQSSYLIYNHNYNDQLSTKSDYKSCQESGRIGVYPTINHKSGLAHCCGSSLGCLLADRGGKKDSAPKDLEVDVQSLVLGPREPNKSGWAPGELMTFG